MSTASGSKRLQDLTSSELSSELSRAGLEISGKNVNDRERLLRLSTFLIDQGEDPVTYEFKMATGSVQDSQDQKIQNERTKLLERVMKFEKSYFSRDSCRGA